MIGSSLYIRNHLISDLDKAHDIIQRYLPVHISVPLLFICASLLADICGVRICRVDHGRFHHLHRLGTDVGLSGSTNHQMNNGLVDASLCLR